MLQANLVRSALTDGSAIGVVPTTLSSRKTLAPVGRESTASAPVNREAAGAAA